MKILRNSKIFQYMSDILLYRSNILLPEVLQYYKQQLSETTMLLYLAPLYGILWQLKVHVCALVVT